MTGRGWKGARLCSFPHTNTAPHQTKGHHGAYKPRISYQVMGQDRGDREGAGAGRADSQRDRDSQPAEPTATSESLINAHDPHPTRLHPTLLLARACDP